jgi:hypothetical protein
MTVREYFEWKPGIVALWAAVLSPVVALFVLMAVGGRDLSPLYLLPALPPLGCIIIGAAAAGAGSRRHRALTVVIGVVTVVWGVAQLALLGLSVVFMGIGMLQR